MASQTLPIGLVTFRQVGMLIPKDKLPEPRRTSREEKNDRMVKRFSLAYFMRHPQRLFRAGILRLREYRSGEKVVDSGTDEFGGSCTVRELLVVLDPLLKRNRGVGTYDWTVSESTDSIRKTIQLRVLRGKLLPLAKREGGMSIDVLRSQLEQLDPESRVGVKLWANPIDELGKSRHWNVIVWIKPDDRTIHPDVRACFGEPIALRVTEEGKGKNWNLLLEATQTFATQPGSDQAPKRAQPRPVPASKATDIPPRATPAVVPLGRKQVLEKIAGHNGSETKAT